MAVETSTPVVVLRCGRHGGLGITRSLGRLGVRVYNVDAGQWVPSFVSRYSAGKFVWDAETAAPEATIDQLEKISRELGGRPILIPTSDSLATLVARNRARLAGSFLFPSMPPELVTGLCSKKEMHYIARNAGIPTPDAAFPQSRAELLECLKTMTFPIMLKGVFGKSLEAVTGKRMYKVKSQEELLQIYDRAEDPSNPNLMLQEFIPGGEDSVWMFNGYFDAGGTCLLGMTGKKIRQYPAYTGLTSLGICLRNDVVDGQTRAFMKAVGYRGILDIGYRYDARDGQYKVLDVNPRVGATFRLFTGENGMDVIRALYLDLTGQPVESAPTPEGRKWLVEDCDLVSCIRYLRDGKLTVKEWIQSHRGVRETGIFAMDDPLPALWMGFRDLQGALFPSRSASLM
jgi:predicted ATP-grasp superfamily ATP-dependent carboligase